MSEALKEIREKFEAWEARIHGDLSDLRLDDMGHYVNCEIHFAWMAFREAALSRSAGPADEPGFDEATESRWQKAIYEVCKEAVGPEHYSEIDGAGCDSGDALDFTITEIQQALEFVRENSRYAGTVYSESKCRNDHRDLIIGDRQIGEKWEGGWFCRECGRDVFNEAGIRSALAESPSESAPAPEGMGRDRTLEEVHRLFTRIGNLASNRSWLDPKNLEYICKQIENLSSDGRQHVNNLLIEAAHPTSESGTDVIANSIPKSFYANRSLEFRIRRLVAEWQDATIANQELEEKLLKAESGRVEEQ